MKYEVGVVTAHPLKMIWTDAVSILRTWRFARKQGVPCNQWYGVYEAGTDVVLAKCGPLPGAHDRASLLVDALSAEKRAGRAAVTGVQWPPGTRRD